MSRAYKMADPEGCLTHQLQTGGSVRKDGLKWPEVCREIL